MARRKRRLIRLQEYSESSSAKLTICVEEETFDPATFDRYVSS